MLIYYHLTIPYLSRASRALSVQPRRTRIPNGCRICAPLFRNDWNIPPDFSLAHRQHLQTHPHHDPHLGPPGPPHKFENVKPPPLPSSRWGGGWHIIPPKVDFLGFCRVPGFWMIRGAKCVPARKRQGGFEAFASRGVQKQRPFAPRGAPNDAGTRCSGAGHIKSKNI